MLPTKSLIDIFEYSANAEASVDIPIGGSPYAYTGQDVDHVVDPWFPIPPTGQCALQPLTELYVSEG